MARVGSDADTLELLRNAEAGHRGYGTPSNATLNLEDRGLITREWHYSEAPGGPVHWSARLTLKGAKLLQG